MDTYFDTEKCVERLYKEYEKHNRLIVAVDFDDTVFDFHSMGTNHKDTLNLLRKCSKLGFIIIIFTASKPSRWQSMLDFMKIEGCEAQAVNKNAIELPYGNDGKIYYNILLDDRAGLAQAYEVLNQVVNKINHES